MTKVCGVTFFLTTPRPRVICVAHSVSTRYKRFRMICRHNLFRVHNGANTGGPPKNFKKPPQRNMNRI